MSDGVVLAIDSSTRRVSCAVAAGGSVVERESDGGVVESLEQVVVEVLGAAGVGIGQVAAVVVGAGPGSFTGIRSGVSFANALSYALPCTVASVSTIDSVALAVAEPGSYTLIALEAGRGRLYVGGYVVGEDGAVQRDLAEQLLETEELSELARGLEGPVRIVDAARPTAAGHLHLAASRPDLLTTHAVAGARPFYVAERTVAAAKS
jgi:N6-L-threonylcarbamoyladenine synthase